VTAALLNRSAWDDNWSMISGDFEQWLQ